MVNSGIFLDMVDRVQRECLKPKTFMSLRGSSPKPRSVQLNRGLLRQLRSRDMILSYARLPFPSRSSLRGKLLTTNKTTVAKS